MFVQGVFAAARAAAPSVIFIDEIDSLAPARGGPNADSSAGEMTGRILSTLLLAMEEGQTSCFLLAQEHELLGLPLRVFNGSAVRAFCTAAVLYESMLPELSTMVFSC